MSRSLTATTVREIFKSETGQAWLVLLTIDHATLGAPIRVSSDGVDTVSRGPLTSADLTANGYDLTLNTAGLWAPGLLGDTGFKGLEQDTSYFASAPLGALDGLGDLTFEAIILPERLAAAGTHQPTLIHARSGANNEFRVQLGLALPANNSFNVIANNGAEVTWDTGTDGLPDLADGTVRRAAVTRNGTTGALELWLQNQGSATATSYGSKTSGSGALDLTGHTLHLGRTGAGGAAQQWKGRYDDVRIWSDIRSQSEIQDNAFTALVGNEAGLTAYWPMTEGSYFLAFPFRLSLPHDVAGEWPRAQLEIDNVDRQIVEALRLAAGSAQGPSVLMEIIRAADPDTVEAAWPDFYLRDATYDALVVAGELKLDVLEREPYPADSYTPSTAPGVFA